MEVKVFDEIVKNRLKVCQATLTKKRKEYAIGVDRLSNFKVAGKLQRCSNEAALGGMLAKHIVSIYDGIDSGNLTEEQWEEKLTDGINYLLLLEGLIKES